AVVIENFLPFHTRPPLLQLPVDPLVDVGFSGGWIYGKHLGHVGLVCGIIGIAPIGKERSVCSASENVLKIGTGIGLVGIEGLGESDPQAAALSPFFRSDEYHPVYGPGTVQGGRGRALQNGNAFEVLHVQVLQVVSEIAPVSPEDVVVHDYPVNYKDWLVIRSQSGVTPDQDLGVAEQAAGAHVNLYPGYPALQCIHWIGLVGNGQVCPADLSDGIPQ